MPKISLHTPTIQIKRDSFESERAFRTIQAIILTMRDSYRTMAQAVNESYDGDIASAGGTTANRPASPRLYQQYYDTTIDELILWDGSNWVDTTGGIS